jgi:hypothetical protein
LHVFAYRCVLKDLRYSAAFSVATQRSPSYAWARHPQLSPAFGQLSEETAQGLAWALELTKDAAYRGQRALRGERLAPAGERELAKRKGVSAQVVSARIEQARRELFGELSLSGVYYRLGRWKKTRSRRRRRCAAPGCGEMLPRSASRARVYCDGACRVRAHRARSGPLTDSSGT